MVHVVITHGRSQEFMIPSDLQEPWVSAFEFGLQRVDSPFANDIEATFAFYGDKWRPDARDDAERLVAPGPMTALEREIAADILANAPAPLQLEAERDMEDERGVFSSLVSIVAALDNRFHVGELALRWFMKDVADYFQDDQLRSLAIETVQEAVTKADSGSNEGVLLMGHSLGTVVAYDFLRRTPDAPVRGFITFGSPLGLPTVRRRLTDSNGQTPYPAGIERWLNVFDPDDFVVGDRYLEPHFSGANGRPLDDVETNGENPGIFDPAAAHDPRTYLSSIALAQGAHDMMLAFWGEPAAPNRRAITDDAIDVSPLDSDELFATTGDDEGEDAWSWSTVTERDFESDAGDGGADADWRSAKDVERRPMRGDFAEIREESTEPSSSGSIGAGRRASRTFSPNTNSPSFNEFASTDTRRMREDVGIGDRDAERGSGPTAAPRAAPPRETTAAAPAPPAEAAPGPPVETAAGSPPSPAPSEEPPMMQRTASADFPPRVEPESENLLQWALGQEAIFGGGSTSVSIPVPEGIREVNLTVSVQASGFEILDPETLKTRNFTRITLNVDEPNQVIAGAFLLRAQKTDTPVPTKIYLRFSHTNLPVGQIELPTTIAPTGAPVTTDRSATIGGAMQVSFTAAPPPDLVFHITQSGDGQRYEIFVDRRTGTEQFDRKELGEFPVTGNAAAFAESILQQFRLARELQPPELRQMRIDGLGLSLWNQLPEQFRDFYWEQMHGKELSIAIHSEEPYIPWELIKPQKMDSSGETGDMFGLAFSIARWKQGRFYPNPLTVSEFVAIAPVYQENALENTSLEAAELIEAYGGRVIPGQYNDVATLLSGKDVQAIHFAGHGQFLPGAPGDSRIELADFPLVPGDILSATIGKSDHPMVFLNACEVGNQGWALTQIGGWADTFCEIGCTAFVGPYWAVNDRVAKAASLLFYAELHAGKTLGEALQTLRRQFWEAAEDRYHPTWLAYSLHCHPNVTVNFTNGSTPAPTP